jgi:hypothetical protein
MPIKASKPEKENTHENNKCTDEKDKCIFNRSESIGSHVEGNVETDSSTEMPNGTTRIIIDKMAEYVSKNGIEFEGIISNKNDERFEFIKSGHKFNSYYRSKIEKLNSSKRDDSIEKKDRIESRSNDDSSDKESTTSSDRHKKHKKSKRHHHRHHHKHHKHHRRRESSQEKSEKDDDKNEDIERAKRSKKYGE